MRRLSNLTLAIVLGLALVLMPALAMAKAKSLGGGGAGSRGARTYQAPPTTPTMPQTKPVERSATSPTPATQQARPAAQAAGPQAQQPGFFQRNPFMSGLMGGLIGAGIAGMLFGNGFGLGGLGEHGMAGGLGLLLQLALLGGGAWLLIGFFRRRMAAPQPAYAGGLPPDAMARGPIDIPSSPGSSLGGSAGVTMPPSTSDEIGITSGDFEIFERLLKEIQTAWSQSDIAALRRLVTPEMLSYFSESLAANASQGHQNHVEDLRLEQGDLSEAWREGPTDFATVAMRWSSLDYTIHMDDDRVVEGDRSQRGETTEVWTFMRSNGGRWLLSAIQ